MSKGLPLNAYNRIRPGSFRVYSSHFLTIGYVEKITGTIRVTTPQNCFHSLHENVHAIIHIHIHAYINVHKYIYKSCILIFLFLFFFIMQNYYYIFVCVCVYTHSSYVCVHIHAHEVEYSFRKNADARLYQLESFSWKINSACLPILYAT